jgi:hypothetical protein
MNATDKKPKGRLLTLHHELLYPAFLGAALFEFARRLVPVSSQLGFSWLASNFLWVATSLWFMLYFSVAFLALAETSENSEKYQFGFWSFITNLLEISLILLVSVLLIGAEPELGKSYDQTLNYKVIFWGWLLIPITGGISNKLSGRHVRWWVTVPAILIGSIGLLSGCLLDGEIGRLYWILLAGMYFLLFCYFRSVHADP